MSKRKGVLLDDEELNKGLCERVAGGKGPNKCVRGQDLMYVYCSKCGYRGPGYRGGCSNCSLEK